MKIKSQLIGTLIIFAFILLIISTSIIYTNERTTELSNQQDIAGNIQSAVGKFSYIANEYYLHRNNSQLTNWEININIIYGNLTEIAKALPQEQNIGSIEVDTQLVDTAFDGITSYLQSVTLDQNVRILPEFQSAWSNLSVKTQTLSIDTANLSQLLRNQTDQTHQSNIILISSLLITFAVFFFTTYLITYRRALKSILSLQNGIKIIGSGNLDYSVKTAKKDEIGELSNSFNQMTMNLKNMTSKLQEQERMAAIGQTAGMVGHDLRNPLQSIIGELYIVRTELQALPEGELKANMQESMNNIEEQINYMDKIVSDLQTFVRPVQVQKQAIYLKQLIENRLAENHFPDNIKVELLIQDNLIINADPHLLKRVLINLITNAIQAMPEGGKLSISAKEEASKVKISFEDTGVGISEEIKPKLFTPLFTTKSKGQGFGLAVCKRVMEAQGGTIKFESENGKGTKFIIEMPVLPAEQIHFFHSEIL